MPPSELGRLPGSELHMLSGVDAIEMLRCVFLSGVQTGAATTMLHFTDGDDNDRGDSWALAVALKMQADPDACRQMDDVILRCLQDASEAHPAQHGVN